MNRQRRFVSAAVAVAMVVATASVAELVRPVDAADAVSFVGLAPARLADTRPGQKTIDGALAGGDTRAAGSVTVVPVTNRGGVPANAAAATLNVTITQPAGPGYATVYPCGQPTPNASNINYDTNQTIANAATVKVGDGGAICVYVSQPTQLIVDVGGYFPNGSSFTGLAPARLADTRPGQKTIDGALAGGDTRAAGSVTVVPVTNRGGVPANAAAATLNVTITQPAGPGYATVYPCGQPTPNASNINYDTNQTIANAATVKVGDGGAICVYVSQPTQLIVDVGGYFPNGSSFTGLAPARLADTRPGQKTIDGALAGGDTRAAGSVTVVPVTNRGGVPANAAAATLNVTITQPAGPGYATVYPCGQPTPNASNINYDTNQTIANAATVKVGDGGAICVYVSQPTQLIVDVGGYFPNGTTTTTVPTNPGSTVPTKPIPFDTDTVFTQESGKSTYWVTVPQSYDATHKTPEKLLVWLHGCFGEASGDIFTVSPGGDAQDWISIAVGGREDGCWDPNSDTPIVMAAIADIETHFNISRHQIILGGYSSGGDLSYRMAFDNANAFAGVIAENTSPFRDTGLTQDAALAEASRKFNVVHLAHTQDEEYHIADVKAEVNAMKNAGFPVTFIERTGMHFDEPNAVVAGQTVPGSDADLINLLLPHIDDGWMSP